MKELTTLSNKFTESQVKKENKFSLSHNFDFACIHFNIYECLKWLENPIWLINTLSLVILQICSKIQKQESQGGSVKILFLTVSQNSQESSYSGVSY